MAASTPTIELTEWPTNITSSVQLAQHVEQVVGVAVERAGVGIVVGRGVRLPGPHQVEMHYLVIFLKAGASNRQVLWLQPRPCEKIMAGAPGHAPVTMAWLRRMAEILTESPTFISI